jgi:membrane glycosyltransferase
MANYDLFVKMEQTEKLYEEYEEERHAKRRENVNIKEQCQDLANKLFDCVINPQLNKILTHNMTINEKKNKCFTEIIKKNAEYNAIEKRNEKLFLVWLQLKNDVYK